MLPDINGEACPFTKDKRGVLPPKKKTEVNQRCLFVLCTDSYKSGIATWKYAAMAVHGQGRKDSSVRFVSQEILSNKKNTDGGSYRLIEWTWVIHLYGG